MNSDDAMYLLGLEAVAVADTAALRRAYDLRKLECEQRLSTAGTDGLKQKYHATLSDLDQAYKLLLGATHPPMGATRSANASTGGTLLRPETVDRGSDGLAIGHVLANRYEIRRVLGQGGMGAVFEAFDRLKQESVAIKVLLPQYLGSEHGRSRFMHEAKIACRLSHPNIVKVFDVGLDPPYHFITMELLEGETLRDQMERRKADRERYSVDEVRGFTRQLVDALAYAHKQIVHRDLKPENVWLCTDGTLKLIDFGIARAFTSSALTRTGMVMGTAYYMAPEQFNGAKDVGWEADQYSLAVIIYELLTGRIPQGRFASTSEVRRDVPLSMSRALLTGLAPEPASRFSSLDEFGTALERRDAMPRVPLAAWLTAAALIAASVGVWWFVGGPVKGTAGVEEAVSTSPVASDAAEPERPVAPPPPVSAAASTEEREAIEMFTALQQRERDLAIAVREQRRTYEGAVRAVEAANGETRQSAEARAADAARELQTVTDIQAENAQRVFSPQFWSANTAKIEAAQAQARGGQAAAAQGQFIAVREALQAHAELSGDLEKFVRARANYLDAKHQWALFSAMHSGAPPDNPAIARAEAGIQSAIDRGEFSRLATEVFPKLTAQYLIALRDARRAAGASAEAEPSTAVEDAGDRISAQTGESPSADAGSQAPQAMTPARAQAARRRQAFLEQCARARRPPANCPKPAE